MQMCLEVSNWLNQEENNSIMSRNCTIVEEKRKKYSIMVDNLQAVLEKNSALVDL